MSFRTILLKGTVGELQKSAQELMVCSIFSFFLLYFYLGHSGNLIFSSSFFFPA